jgi:hypothetical protein
MQTKSRRRLDRAIIGAGGLVVGVAAIGGALVGDVERVERLWTSAALARDGSAQVTEVIDYDFGAVAANKHGIFRVVPGLAVDDAITVSSDDAPDAVEVTRESSGGGPGVRIRIGDPDTTVTGRHRYRIEYPLAGVAQGTTVDWEPVGLTWEVGIEEAEIHLVAPFELDSPTCFRGGAGSTDACEVRDVEPGHLVAIVEGLDAGEGVSIEARAGSDLAEPPAAPAPPTSPPDDSGTGLLPPAGTAAAAALVAGGAASALVRRAGRERVSTGGAADAAWGGAAPPGATPAGEVLVDADDLASLATTDFAPPEYLTPSQGGIVLTEEVRQEHKVAWLIQSAIDGALDIGSNGDRSWEDMRLVRTGPGTPEEAAVLDLAFAGSTEIELGTYDRNFATAWGHLEQQLRDWQESSQLWDPAGSARKIVVRVVGIVAAIAGLAATVGGGLLANRDGPAWLLLAAAGGVLAGAGLAAALRAWELRVRTPAGSAAWLRVESFRRFLAESEAFHASEAAKRGVLREYTAWAVAVGEIDRWQRAISAAAIPPQVSGVSYAYAAPFLLASTASTATAPTSSGGGGFGGGFGGGSVGGGAGGGGGGSW